MLHVYLKMFKYMTMYNMLKYFTKKYVKGSGMQLAVHEQLASLKIGTTKSFFH